MKIVFEDIESPPCCLLTLGTFTVMFLIRSDAENFLRFLTGRDDIVGASS
ncbi:hypothetical protein PSFL6913_06285 [Pseudomonas fluorescens]|uniref:Uncharacterized protein n=2 Tax=Pseudomonas fluorescens TaxID=294 RepID=A0ABY1TJD3_PSEFL|nr:hypothetical protein [Pseudomonas sp.]RMO73207.1 hypothetical protein ALQ35_02617 [Pseudomonas fluorescens]SNY13217.1 hypothetical protein SAMN04488487_5391 [Pseudomonas fluorescens]SQF91845.1 Uncharacterised protein [Pseudomonas fluorescens]